MKTIKIIDLLNKIANGEDVPKNIKYEDYNWFWCEACHIYETTLYNEKGNKTINLYTWFSDEGNLNDEVEILEEEKKIPEIIHWHEENGVGNDDDAFYVDVNDKSQYVNSEYDSWEMTVILKINEIIDYLESKEKGE